MNRRLHKGEIFGKLAASILASTLLLPLLPVAAQDADGLRASEASIKTLPPLSEAEETPAAAPTKTSLHFTPEIASPKQSKTIVHLGDDTGSGTTDSAPSAVSATTNDADRESKAAKEIEPEAPAAAETTEAAPLVSDKEGEDTKTSGDGKEVAQGPRAPRNPMDPAFRKLPVTTGTVKVRKDFNKFPTNKIIHNLSFRDTPVREVVAEIGHQGNLNIIIDKSVVGRITGDLHDVTLNEAMDTVLASAGLQWRQLDNSTVVIASPNAFVSLGLNRTSMRTFKLSYSNAFEVASLLWASVFNKGTIPDFTSAVRNRSVNVSRETPQTKSAEEVTRIAQAPAPGGGTQTSKSSTLSANTQDSNEENEQGEEQNMTTRPDTQRILRGSARMQTNEGTGFNSGAIDPGSQTIRANTTVVTDFTVDQNGGGAIVIPDAKNNQIVVVGTEDDLVLAEEAIHLLDRRPKQIHIQASLIELTNQGIRQLGASLNLQGQGASGTVLGGSGSPLISFLPGLGSPQQYQTLISNGNQVRSDRIAGISPLPVQFSGGPLGNTFAGSAGNIGAASASAAGAALGAATAALVDVAGTGVVPANGFGGFIGNALPLATPSIAGITAVPQAATGFNFLTLGRGAGGRANIATLPTGLNLSVNLVLQNNKAKVLANPSVIVNDNTESLITLANEVVHKVTTTVSLGVVSTNVELVKAGVFLNVLPKASEDGFVTMRIRPQVSSPLGGPQVFANGQVVVTLLNVREIIAQEVRVKDGQTLVLGGLFSEQEASTLAKVPYLAEAPILGAIFRNSIKGRNRTELMLMITPKVVEEAPVAPSVGDTGTNGPTM